MWIIKRERRDEELVAADVGGERKKEHCGRPTWQLSGLMRTDPKSRACFPFFCSLLLPYSLRSQSYKSYILHTCSKIFWHGCQVIYGFFPGTNLSHELDSDEIQFRSNDWLEPGTNYRWVNRNNCGKILLWLLRGSQMEGGLEEDIRTLLAVFIQCFSNVFITLWTWLINVSCEMFAKCSTNLCQMCLKTFLQRQPRTFEKHYTRLVV
jgi:hypothetical protein